MYFFCLNHVWAGLWGSANFNQFLFSSQLYCSSQAVKTAAIFGPVRDQTRQQVWVPKKKIGASRAVTSFVIDPYSPKLFANFSLHSTQPETMVLTFSDKSWSCTEKKMEKISLKDLMPNWQVCLLLHQTRGILGDFEVTNEGSDYRQPGRLKHQVFPSKRRMSFFFIESMFHFSEKPGKMGKKAFHTFRNGFQIEKARGFLKGEIERRGFFPVEKWSEFFAKTRDRSFVHCHQVWHPMPMPAIDPDSNMPDSNLPVDATELRLRGATSRLLTESFILYQLDTWMIFLFFLETYSFMKIMNMHHV